MPRVLIVDDDEDIRESLQEVLADAGYQVRTAANGEEALQRLAASELPCVVLLDLMMPVLDGRGVLQRVRADARLRDLKVVVLTAGRTDDVHGADLLLRKPVGLEALYEAVEEVCGEHVRP